VHLNWCAGLVLLWAERIPEDVETLRSFFVIRPTRYTNFTNLLWHETLHVSASSSVRHQEFIHCTLSNGICHTAFEQDQDETAVPSWSCSKALQKLVWHMPLLSVQWINSWRWTEELSETCRISYKNKFVKLVYLVGFITKKFFIQSTHNLHCLHSKSSKYLDATAGVGFHRASNFQCVCGNGSECLVCTIPLSVLNCLLHLTVQHAVQIMEATRTSYGHHCGRWATAWLVIVTWHEAVTIVITFWPSFSQ
jgi:hypothetical protein